MLNTTEILNWQAKITAVALLKWPGLLAARPLLFLSLPLLFTSLSDSWCRTQEPVCALHLWGKQNKPQNNPPLLQGLTAQRLSFCRSHLHAFISAESLQTESRPH